ncbi:hypothetical protein VST7929_02683 [Vibrio stylophorae]|uniref:Lipopeptide n=1 Tax=Vibrio stylophorae TaxID=659351 RepID=A0ABM8ZWK6_9VIBR|nr:lipoprotein [Vibrio stylophorae]CAH0534733.1 hypothetical protein VST7929_02683 [Vibrio stylophorae]
MAKVLKAAMLLTVLAVAGCGQTGPLYHPADDVQQTQPE